MRLINFFDYKILLNYLIPISNFLFIITIPEDIVNSTLDKYIILSVLVNAALLIVLSNKSTWTTSILTALFVLSLFIFFENLILFYGLLILQFDYIISLLQKKFVTDFLKTLIKISYVIAGFLFLLDFQFGIYVRIVLIVIFLSFVYLTQVKNDISELKVEKSLLHIAVTHIGYYGPLYLIALVDFNRIWYISFQINLFIILRLIDTYIKDFVSLSFVNIKNVLKYILFIILEVVMLQVYFPSNILIPLSMVSSILMLLFYTYYLSKTAINES